MLIKYPKTKEECLANKDHCQNEAKQNWLNANGIGTIEACTG